MLAYILAVVVGTGSVGLYLAAFFLPAVHRKQDFIWSGVGLFYALFLWLYAHQVTGGILVGQTSSVVLLGWLTWQIFNLRRQVVEPLSQQTPIPNSVNKSNPKAAKSIAKPTATTPASTPLANTRVPAKAATTPDRATKTTSNSTSTAANKFTTSVAPVVTEAAPRERKAAPASTPPVPTPSNLDPVKAAPVERKTAPAAVGVASSAEVAAPLENRTQSAIPATPPQPLLVAAEEERAWITLEVKPASVPSPPLGTPAPPPAVKVPPTPQSRVVPAVAPDRDIPTESIQTTTKIDPEDGKSS
jgi:Ycf66 protein N-terminus